MIKTELELFTYLKDRYLQDLQMSVDKFSTFDCISEYGKLLLELKSRTTHYEDLILEGQKYSALMAKAAELGYAAWYVNSTPKGVYAFNLSKLTPSWTTKLLPAASNVSTLQVISKKVTFLYVEQALAL